MKHARPAASLAAALSAALVVASALGAAACVEPVPAGDSFEDGEDLPGGDTTNTLLLGSNAFSRAAENVSAEHELLFYSGNSFFSQNWVEVGASTESRDGLGPVFNARSCGACHFRDGRGRPPLKDDAAPDDTVDGVGLLFRLSDAAGGPEPTYGGQLQPFALPDVPGEGRVSLALEQIEVEHGDVRVPLLAPRYAFVELAHGPLADGALSSPRVAPQMIGLGLLEAIGSDALAARADPNDDDGDGISGRLAMVDDIERGALAPGRFGWKAEQPTVRQQSAGAFNGDIGITSSLFPQDDCTSAQAECRAAPGGDGDSGTEIADDLLLRVVAYSSLLAPPLRPDAREPSVLEGKRLFLGAGCAACHVASYVTAASDPFAELGGQLIWPYTDLLLHDMGPLLSDERASGDADGAEWRTPPLWGIGRFGEVSGHTRLLHDGRADGVREAIAWHGGEARESAARFFALSDDDQALVIGFVESL